MVTTLFDLVQQTTVVQQLHKRIRESRQNFVKCYPHGMHDAETDPLRTHPKRKLVLFTNEAWFHLSRLQETIGMRSLSC